MSLVERVANRIGKEVYGWNDNEPNKATGFMMIQDATDSAKVALAESGFVTCQTCGGKGRIYTEPNDPGYTCSACKGLGVVPSEAMTERAAKAIYNTTDPLAEEWVYLSEATQDLFRNEAKAALLVAFGGNE